MYPKRHGNASSLSYRSLLGRTTNLETPIEKKDTTIKGVHVLKSYLHALAIPVAVVNSPVKKLSVSIKTGGVVDVLVDPPDSYDHTRQRAVVLDSKDLISFDLERSLAALHKVTETAGYGRPLPFDRGERSDEKISYNDNFEDVYLRHSLFRRVPDATPEQMEPYTATLKGCARKAFYKWQSSFKSMGFGEEDLINIGRIYLMSFLHFYAISEDIAENKKLLAAFLKQRFGEAAKIIFKKALNSTCLPQHVASDVSESEDGEVSFIETFAESADASPDDEYEEDTFILTFPDGVEKRLVVVNDGWLGLHFYLDRHLLSKTETSRLTEDIRSGKISKRNILNEVKEETEEEISQRQKAAKEELYKKLAEMEFDERTTVLGYAALSRDYNPDARRTARKLADELVCPKCECKISSGEVCFTCKVKAIPLFGVDYVKFKEKLVSQNHPMAEAMTAPIPEGEVRARTKRPANTSPKAFVDLVKTKEVSIEEVQLVMSKESKIAMSRKMADELMKTLPDFLECPKCKKMTHKTGFGIRVTHNKSTGLPYRAARQSYCKPCRRPK